MRNSPIAKTVRDIECRCYWKEFEFQVGTRYLTLRIKGHGASYGKWRLDITQPIADRLRSIADMHPADDANRVFCVVKDIFEVFHPKFTGEA